MDLAVALNTTICARLDATNDAVEDAARHIGRLDFEDKLKPIEPIAASE